MDNYRLAVSTHAFLRIEHESVDPQEVTSILGLAPTLATSVKESGNERTGPHGKVWVLSSAWTVNSRDISDHLKWLTDSIGLRRTQLKTLRQRGCDVKIYCLWFGKKGGYGGPRLTPEVIQALAQLELELYFDVGSI